MIVFKKSSLIKAGLFVITCLLLETFLFSLSFEMDPNRKLQ